MKHFSAAITIALLSAPYTLASAEAPSDAANQADSGVQKGCDLAGNAYVEHDVNIYSERTAGTPVATLTGMPVQLRLSRFPAERGGRAQVVTGGATGVRISGYVDPTQVRLISQKPILVSRGFWIAPGTDLRFSGARPNALLVKKQVNLRERRSIETWASCQSLGLDLSNVETSGVPAGAQAYLASKGTVQVRERPAEASPVIAQLRTRPWSDGLLFWVTQRQDGFARVLYRADVIIEGWVALARVTLIKRSGIQPVAQGVSRRLPNLEIAGEPRRLRTTRDLPLRLKASTHAGSVGLLQANTEVFAVDEIGGWLGILPSALNVVAPDRRQFWVPARDVAPKRP